MDKLLEILSDLHPEVDFETETQLIDSGILDSFDIINLVTEIADAYDVVVNAKYIVPKNFNSAKAIYAMIKEIEDEQ